MLAVICMVLISTTLCVSLYGTAFAAGTPAGTTIDNQATVNYLIGATALSSASNTVSLQVDELLDLSLTWQDAGNVAVRPGDSDRILTFLLTNTGNGTETFPLSLFNGETLGDQFDPQNGRIYLDDGDGLYNAATDQLYNAASNIPTLSADGTQTIFVRNDIQADPGGPADGELAISRLTATAQTGSGVAGTSFPPAVPGAPSSVVGTSGGSVSSDGAYVASRIVVTLTKSAVVLNPFGGTAPVPGATLTYSIAIAVSGSGTARSLSVSDVIPSDTTYVAGSMRLIDGATTILSDDPGDGDAGGLAENPLGSGNYEVTLTLGDQTVTTKTFTFQVTID